MFQSYQSHRTPKQHYTMRLLTLAVLPIAIYLLQVAGKVYGIASFVAGLLIFLKIFLDLIASLPAPAPRTHAPVPHHPYTLQAPSCHLCRQANKILVPYIFDHHHHLWVCQECDHCLSFSQHYA